MVVKFLRLRSVEEIAEHFGTDVRFHTFQDGSVMIALSPSVCGVNRIRIRDASSLEDNLGSIVFVKHVTLDGYFRPRERTYVIGLGGEQVCSTDDEREWMAFRHIFCDQSQAIYNIWARLRTRAEVELFTGKIIPYECASTMRLGGLVTIELPGSYDSDFRVFDAMGELVAKLPAEKISRFIWMFAKDVYEDEPFDGCNLSEPINILFSNR